MEIITRLMLQDSLCWPCSLGECTSARRWADRVNISRRELLGQVYNDGVDFEGLRRVSPDGLRVVSVARVVPRRLASYRT